MFKLKPYSEERCKLEDKIKRLSKDPLTKVERGIYEDMRYLEECTRNYKHKGMWLVFGLEKV